MYLAAIVGVSDLAHERAAGKQADPVVDDVGGGGAVLERVEALPETAACERGAMRADGGHQPFFPTQQDVFREGALPVAVAPDAPLRAVDRDRMAVQEPG